MKLAYIYEFIEKSTVYLIIILFHICEDYKNLSIDDMNKTIHCIFCSNKKE